MGRGRSVIAEQTKRVVESAFTSQFWGQELLKAQGLDPSRLSGAAPMDDEQPPSPPMNVTLTPFLGSLNVEWSAAPLDDHVEQAVIEYTPAGGTAQTITVREQNGYVIPGLQYKNYTVRVKFIDLWGRESTWSTGIVGKPNEGADYKFDVERARQQGNLTSLIPAINTDLLAGENFAENAVRQISLAQPEHGNELPLSEVDFDAWPNNQTWPPPDTDALGVRYINAIIPSLVTAKVVDRNAVKWLEIVRQASALSGVVIPFSDFKTRGVQPGVSYIASAYVQGGAGTRVRFGVGGSLDSAGTTQLTMAQTDVVTLDGNEAGQRIYVKFTGDPSYRYIRLRLENVDGNSTTRWTRFQLERADSKTEPSGWTPGIFSQGVVNARMLTAIDANIASGIFKNAAIDSAAIKDLTADKIKAGTINTTEIVVATLLRMASGGKIQAGNTQLDSGGLSLAAQSSYNTTAMLRSSKITDTELGRSAIAFYQNNSSNWNGVVMRADGDSSHDGIIAIHATRSGDLAHLSTARIEALSVASGAGQVHVWQDLIAERHVRALSKVLADGDIEGQGDVWGRKANGDWVSLLGHSHATHNHPFIKESGPSNTEQIITGLGLWVKGSMSANSWYMSKNNVWRRVVSDSADYLKLG